MAKSMIGTEIVVVREQRPPSPLLGDADDEHDEPPALKKELSLLESIEQEDWSAVRKLLPLRGNEKGIVRLYGTKTTAVPLHALCKNKRTPLDILTQCLDLYPEATETRDSCFGILPVHVACRSGHASIEWVDRLLRSYTDSLDVPDDSGNLPMHLACSFGSMDLIRYLVDRCTANQLEHRNSKQQTPLHLACSRSDVTATVIKHLLDKCQDACAIPDWQGQAPLHKAVMWKVNSTIVELLLEAHPATARFVDRRGLTPYGISRKIKGENDNHNATATTKLLRKHQKTSGAKLLRFRDGMRFRLEAVGDAVPKSRKTGVRLPRDPASMYPYQHASKC